MNKNESIAISMTKRIAVIAIVLIILMGAGVLAGRSKLNSVKIVFSDKTELSVITSKSKVSEILDENNIIILDDETVTPGLDETIDGNREIVISRGKIEDVENVTVDKAEILNSYASIVEKIIKEQEEIPFETITKEVNSSATGTKVNKVIQEGVNGIKEITYKVKYQDDVEIERTKISEAVIQEPVNKIIQVSTKVTSRASTSRTTTAVANTAEVSGDSEASARAWIVYRESRGNYNAVNGRYYGAYQMDSSRLNGDYSVENQDAVAERYVASRYGSWTNAKSHWLVYGWY